MIFFNFLIEKRHPKEKKQDLKDEKSSPVLSKPRSSQPQQVSPVRCYTPK